MAIDLSRLNNEQKAAVKQIEGPVMVLAGAGTGKTTVITFRICHMLQNGIDPEDILAVTFTNKAAREMKERMLSLVPSLEPDQLTMCTFHSFCCRVLRIHARKLGYNGNFGIADEGDSTDIIKEIITNRHLKTEDFTVPFFISGISNAKNDLKEPEELRSSSRAFQQKIGEVYYYYQKRLKQLNLIDFDDLLRLTVKLWQDHPEVLKYYQDRYRYVMVDEYQDTNHCQAKLLSLIVGDRNNICVVGDDDQSIYGWRGADIKNILSFPEQYPDTKTIKLEENYRSTDLILRAANTVIAHNSHRHGKALWSSQADGENLKLVEGINGDDEAKITVEMIRNYAFEKELKYSDIAILYRSNHLSRAFEVALRKHTVPYKVVGSKAFYERREIKDAAAYLKIIVNPRDDLALRRILNVPPRGIGSKTLEQIETYANERNMNLLAALQSFDLRSSFPERTKAELNSFVNNYNKAVKQFEAGGSLAETINDYLNSMNYTNGLKRIYKNHEESMARRENVLEFINSAFSFHGRTLLDFLEVNSLMDAQDKVEDDNDGDEEGVTLMTVHAAKGLEFPMVFIVGMEQGIFPHDRSLQERDVDEERRLFYVAVTRAKRHLIMTRALKRQTFGSTFETRTSQFLFELPEELVTKTSPAEMFAPASQDDIAATLAKMKAMFSDD